MSARGYAHLQMKDLTRAGTDIDKALLLAPKSTLALANKIQLLISGNDHCGAIPYYDRVLAPPAASDFYNRRVFPPQM